MSSRTLLRIGVGALAAIVAALGIAQLLLPRIAAKAMKGIVAKYGDVQRVSVSAFPAIQMLWGEADSAEVTASRLSISPKQLVSVLLEANGVKDVTLSASEIVMTDPGFGAGPIALRNVTFRKEGSLLHASATLSEEALTKALPEGFAAQVLGGEGGGINVRAGGQLFGFRAFVLAKVHAEEGKLLLTPTQSLLAGLGRITLFSNEKLSVLSVSAARGGGAGDGGAGRGAGGGGAGTPQGGATPEAWVISGEAKLL